MEHGDGDAKRNVVEGKMPRQRHSVSCGHVWLHNGVMYRYVSAYCTFTVQRVRTVQYPYYMRIISVCSVPHSRIHTPYRFVLEQFFSVGSRAGLQGVPTKHPSSSPRVIQPQ